MVKYGPRKGLIGPYAYPNGQVLYFDPKEGQYWDPTTDFYLESNEINNLKQSLFNLVAAQNG